ncbi:MAG: ATP-binding protein [Curvibacter sp.]|jgi:two-component system osmolarity sensor histidine kinase EnvZ|nr:HAMP domain-containing protein [Curvibacter sp.]
MEPSRRQSQPSETQGGTSSRGAPIETTSAEVDGDVLGQAGLSLFWRTFFLLSVLLFGSILAWLQTLRVLEFEPRAIQTAQQIASLVNLSRAALVHSDAIMRVSLIKSMTEEEGVRVLPREPGDRIEPYDSGTVSRRIVQELTARLGPGTVVGDAVNGKPGLWVGFTIDRDQYWLFADRERFNQTASKTWLIWLSTGILLSLAGAAIIARLINRPLKQLSFAASRIREGDFAASRLNERVPTTEIRQVNIGFNRMAQRLAKIEQDRAVMLAGISHDLRTPLSRLRLETEMSVSDPDAQAHMVADLEQLDAIIDKFMDYARPDHVRLTRVNLNEVIRSSLFVFKGREDMRFNLDLRDNVWVMADAVELGRVISNLVENARRYGKTLATGITTVDISTHAREPWVLICVSDHGPGVAPEHLPNLTKPFYRGDSARTAATGAGLGLSIVEKTVRRMGGKFGIGNSSRGGFTTRIQLHEARG